jgi:hypothetical protein
MFYDQCRSFLFVCSTGFSQSFHLALARNSFKESIFHHIENIENVGKKKKIKMSLKKLKANALSCSFPIQLVFGITGLRGIFGKGTVED